MASVPNIYNVNKSNIKMFQLVPNPTAQDELRLASIWWNALKANGCPGSDLLMIPQLLGSFCWVVI